MHITYLMLVSLFQHLLFNLDYIYTYIHPYRTFIEGTFDRIQAQISHFQFENNRGINLHIQKKKI